MPCQRQSGRAWMGPLVTFRADSPGAAKFAEMATASNFKAGPFAPESYDGAALILLAMQAANSTDSNVFKAKVMDVANAPGEKIFPGELGKALKLISEGKDVDYVGASAVELVGAGELLVIMLKSKSRVARMSLLVIARLNG